MPAARSVLNRRGRECDRHDDADDDGPLTAVLDTDSNRNGVSRRGRNHRQASPKKLSRKNSIFRLLLRSGFFLVILWSAIVLHLSSWTNLLDSPTVVGSGGVNSRQTNSYDASNQRRHNHHQEPFFYRLIPSRSSKLPSQQSLLLYPGGRSSSDPWEYGQKVKWPPPSAFEARRLKTRPNYMGLQFQSLSSSGSAGQGSDGHHHHYHHHKHLDFTRVILPDDDARYNDMKSAQLRTFDKNTNDEEVDPDDPQRYQPWDEQQPIEDTELTGGCFRLKYTHGIARYGTCNEFHAVSLDRPHEDNEYAIKYFGRGFFRQVWGLMDLETREAEAVMKVNRFFDERGFNNYAFQQTHHETLAMLLTHSSKLVMDIYGMCGTTTLVEPGSEFEEHVMPNDWEWPTEEELKELKADGDVKPMNNLTAEQKLEYALAMAEGLAELHGNPFGTMVSHDVGFDQWLFSKRDGLLKMNDINKCRPLYFNKERNEYCKIWSHQSDSYRAPEEIHGGYIDESADVVAWGKFLYSILTGLTLYWDVVEPPNRGKKGNELAFHKEIPYVDDRWRRRSYIEGRLVEVMELAWQPNRKDRVDIFTVVSHLRETARLALTMTNRNNATAVLQKVANK